MNIEVHLLSHDDEQMIEWAFRHWAAVGASVVLHDGGPTGRSAAIAARYPNVKVRPWDTAGELNDELARKLKNECWRGTDADWVIVVDADELIWFNDPGIVDGRQIVTLKAAAEHTLGLYDRMGAAVIKPHGFEMFSDEWFESTYEGPPLITSIVRDGAPDDKWYAKPVVFSPRRVAESGFGIGAHESRPVLRDGRTFHVGKDWPCCDGLALLHFKSIFGGLERIAERYDATRRRLALVNVRNGWGNFAPGIVHAREKRDLLLPHVRRVVA